MPRHAQRQRGFSLLWLLFMIAGLGVGMAALGAMWHTAAQREKEAELLFVGDQYRRAIERFAKLGPGDGKRLPKSLDELLLDPRFPNTVRHLRRLYPDPMTGRTDWGLVRDAKGGIFGLHSLAPGQPLKVEGFFGPYQDFAGKAQYREWVFSVGADAAVAPAQNDAPDGGGAGKQTETQQAETPPGTQDSGEAVRRHADCLRAKDQAATACRALPGQAQRECQTQAYTQFRACLGLR